MENLQECNSSRRNGTLYKNNSEIDKLNCSRCSKLALTGAGAGPCKGFVVGATQDECVASGCGDNSSSSSWLTCAQQHSMLNNNNNNNNSIELNMQNKCNDGATTETTKVALNVTTDPLAKHKTDACICAGIDKRSNGGGGGDCSGEDARDESHERKLAEVQTDGDIEMKQADEKKEGALDLQVNGAESVYDEAMGMAAAAALAVSRSDELQACNMEAFAEAAAMASLVSRNASVNNSTENLSFNSDNFYADDLLLLEGDADLDDVEVEVDGEELSLNSDDCIYAYRGDGADFDLALDSLDVRRRGTANNCMMDDETDFLEMDFEPDPLSEVEYGSVEAAAPPSHADAFLMQRDACHLSGRHSATLGHYGTSGVAAEQRLLFSSPIDDSLAPPPAKTLQSQLMLSKNFARITMHLDQIKGENGDCDATHAERQTALGIEANDGLEATVGGVTSTAHSLPNAILSNFGRDLLHTKEDNNTKAESASKVTGAKPKRISTFSTSSSTSSKNSSKSRNSLRASYAVPTLCNSVSFDERSASCAEFRSSAADKMQSAKDDIHGNSGNVVVSAATKPRKDCDDFSAHDDTCLDCLEKEFLANTIGKAMDPNECARCRKRSSSSMVLFKRGAQTPKGGAGTTRCRSGSPLYFRGGGGGGRDDDCIYETAVGDYLQPRNMDWLTSNNTADKSAYSDGVGKVQKNESCAADDALSCDENSGRCVNGGGGGGTNLMPRVRRRVRARTCDAKILQQFKSEDEQTMKPAVGGDGNYGGEHLLKNLLLTEKEIVTVSTLNLSQELLVQALDKLHVAYNLDIIKSHLYYNNTTTTTIAINAPIMNTTKNLKDFKDLRDLLMHESKKHCNHPKLKRLIELATRQQVQVQFQQDAEQTATAMVPVKVSDILQLWLRTKNIAVLKHLDKRFIEANVLGKIANIIRQSQQQRCTQRRPLPEHILIPQYYAVGKLRLTKKF